MRIVLKTERFDRFQKNISLNFKAGWKYYERWYRGDFDKRFDGKFTSEKEANAAFQVYQETNKSGKELVTGRFDDALTVIKHALYK